MGEFQGLSQQEADQRLVKFGLNEIREARKVSALQILIRQIKANFIIYILAVATAISFFVGKDVTGYTILAVIGIVIGTGFFQEFRAEKAVAALKKMILPVCLVIRSGKTVEIDSRNLVPDDIVTLRAGERIPADCVVLDAEELYVNESILTGESREVQKVKVQSETPERENLIFMGTFVVKGKCSAKVVHTGMNTEFGKIAKMIETSEKELPLQKKVNGIAKYMASVAIVVSTLTGLVMVMQADSLTTEVMVDILIVMIALSVSAFPEGFPIVLTTTLAAGAYRMAKKNAIVNRMSIIETLGETTVICTDKTGTLTKGEMTVREVFSDGQQIMVEGVGYSAEGRFLQNNNPINPKENAALMRMLRAVLLCNDAKIEEKEERTFHTIGSATESALLILGAKAGVYREDIDCTPTAEIPFSSERKFMALSCVSDDGHHVYAKGALEVVLPMCRQVMRNGVAVDLTDEERQNILARNDAYDRRSLRTLAIATRAVATEAEVALDQDLVFLGLVAMEDPPRDEVKDAIAQCREASIAVKMITGDSKDTAASIAGQIGIYGNVIDGAELDKLSDEELAARIRDIGVFARVKPEHKLRIVRLLKEHGEIVTMTGDGVNDAPALKEAHIGVAMGKNGTDVSREASDLILKDDNFATIVLAIEEGRTIFSNVRKFVTYQLSTNFAELSLIFVSVLLGFPVPLIALQILFMNLVTDDMPAITLGFNPMSKDVMDVPPRRESNILNKTLFSYLVLAGSVMAFLAFGMFYYTHYILGLSIEEARTATLITIVFLEIANAFNYRSFKKPVVEVHILANKYLIIASTLSIIATLLVVYTPINSVFGTAPIAWQFWLLALGLSFTIIIVFDSMKTLNRFFHFFPSRTLQ